MQRPRPAVGRRHTTETRRAQLDASLAAMPDDAFAPWSKAGWRAYTLMDQCLGWPAPSRRDPILTGTATITRIPSTPADGRERPRPGARPGAGPPGSPMHRLLSCRMPDTRPWRRVTASRNTPPNSSRRSPYPRHALRLDTASTVDRALNRARTLPPVGTPCGRPLLVGITMMRG